MCPILTTFGNILYTIRLIFVFQFFVNLTIRWQYIAIDTPGTTGESNTVCICGGVEGWARHDKCSKTATQVRINVTSSSVYVAVADESGRSKNTALEGGVVILLRAETGDDTAEME